MFCSKNGGIFTKLKLCCSLLFVQFFNFHEMWAEVFEPSMFFYNPSNNNFIKRKKNLTAEIDIALSTVCAKESFNKSGKTVPLFGRFGRLKIREFSESSLTEEPLGGSIYDHCPATKNFQNDIAADTYNASKDSKVYCGGKLDSYELSFGAKFSLPDLPLYFCLSVPFRSIECKNMEFCDSVGKKDKYLDFLNENIDKVLLENNFEPLSKYVARGISDLTIGLGWSCQERFFKTFVKSSRYDVAAGVVLPFSTMFQPAKNFLFHIPLGHGGYLGAFLKYEFGIEFNHRMEVVLFGENVLFLNRRNTYKILHNKKMSYFNLFKEREVNSHRGSYWTVGGHLKTRLIVNGVFLLLGYTFHSQEASYFENERLHQKQEKLVDMQELNKFISNNPGLREDIRKYDREGRYVYTINEKLINKDPRLSRSDSHIFHASVLFQPTRAIDWCDNARCFISYHHPFMGKSSFAGIGFSGQFGVGVNIDF